MSERKNKQLGMNHSTASGRLVKDLLWDFVKKSGQCNCYKCGEVMTRETFSIEHKTPWLDSENPVELYFDIDNISYSHLSCNVSDARKVIKPSVCGTRSGYNKGCRCAACVDYINEYNRSRYTPEARHERFKRTGR